MNVLRKIVKPLFAVGAIVLLIPATDCNDLGTEAYLAGGNVICYEKSYNSYWEIFTNNIAGTNPQNISNYQDDDEYPQWSPDGRYVVFSRSVSLNGPLICVCDLQTGTLINLTPDGGGADLNPEWTPNGKVCFGYPYNWAKYRGTYIMNPDGSGKKKILDLASVAIYFYPDGFTFLYIVDYTRVYKSNIDMSANEFLFDIQQALNQQVVIEGFDPSVEELLISPTTADGKDAIATYGVRTRSLKILLTADEGYTFFHLKYSSDCSKIAFVEHSSNDEYLSVLSNGVKKRLVRIPASTPPVYFSFNGMQFSSDGGYIAFSKQVFNSGQWVSWVEYLYAVEVSTGNVHYVDKGFHPTWNSRP